MGVSRSSKGDLPNLPCIFPSRLSRASQEPSERHPSDNKQLTLLGNSSQKAQKLPQAKRGTNVASARLTDWRNSSEEDPVTKMVVGSKDLPDIGGHTSPQWCDRFSHDLQGMGSVS